MATSMWRVIKEWVGAARGPRTVVVDLHATADASCAEAASVAGLRVLLIDGDTDTRQLLATTLRSYGADVISMDSMHDATAALGRVQPDVVVSNCAMDAKDVAELMRQVRLIEARRQRRIPTIAVTPSDRGPGVLDETAARFHIRVPRSTAPRRLAEIIGRVAAASAAV